MLSIPTIHITCQLEQDLIVPVNYQHLLQAFVYSLLPEEDASVIHDQGILHGNRTFRPLCFSRLISSDTKYDRNTRTLIFKQQIQLSIGSVSSTLIEKITNHLLLTKSRTLHGQKIIVDLVQFNQNHITESTLLIKAISPITVYSTFVKRNGAKITHYFQPHDLVFEHLIQENFAKKYEAFTEQSLGDETELLHIRPVEVKKNDKVITNYKNTWIVGYTGIYELQAKPEYLSFILDSGLGTKNGSGFGMVIPVDEKNIHRGLNTGRRCT